MKKIAFAGLLAGALLNASEYNYEFSPMAGYAFPNSGQELKDHGVYGAEMQFNNFESAIKPELSVFYSNPDYKHISGDTHILRSALSGVYEYEKIDDVVPFVKLGLGYEAMTDNKYDNHDTLFANAGTGIKVDLADQIAFKFEVIDMVKINGWDNNLLVMAGLSFAFGEKEQPAAPEPAPEPVVEPIAAAVAAPVAEAPLDSDNDGVTDAQDKCPNTPVGFKVDMDGCPLKTTLPVHFAFDSVAVDETGMAKVNEFSTFMKESPAYDATIIGHADSTGPTEYNQRLSERRAEKVKSLLIDKGIAEDRLNTLGEGEKMPTASNTTKEGRAANRRIEVELGQ
ncbi:MAG: OmpA family protein [Sulfuricurvum sp.]